MEKKKKNNKKGGFTLVELLVAISIIGIITVITVPSVSILIEAKNRKTYEQYGESLVSSAKLYADAYDVDLFGMHPSGCMKVNMDTLKQKKLVKDVKIKNADCNTEDTYVIVKKVNGKYSYQEQLKCVKNGKSTVLYDGKITRPICTDESIHEGPKIKLENPKSGWVRTDKAYVSIEISDIDGLLENNEVKYMWSRDAEGTNIVFEKKLNFGNDLNDTNVVKRVSRPKEDGKFYLIVQPINVVDVFGNYTTVKEVKGVYKFDANAPSCETTFKLKSESVAEKTWTNQNVDLVFDIDEDVYSYKWITYKDGEENETSNNERDPETMVITTDKSLKASGVRTYRVIISDEAGNKSECEYGKDYYIDKEVPTCSITPESDKWYTKDVELTLKTVEEISGLDGKSLTTSTTAKYDGTTKGTQSADSKGQVWYGYVKDKAGNVNSCNTNVKMDQTKPVLTVTNSSNGEWTNQNVVITANASDVTSDIKVIEYSHNNTDWLTDNWDSTSTKTSKKGTWTGERNNKFYVRAKDNAGNIYKVETAIKIDKTAPTLTIKNSSDGKWTNDNVKITATYSDTASGVVKLEYSYDKNSWTNWDLGDTPGEKVGTWSVERDDTLYIRATDKAGNTTIKSTKVRIDKSVPTLTVINSSDGKWTNQNVKITATASDAKSDIVAIEYSHNNDKWLTDNWDSSSTATNKTGTWSGERNNSFYVRARDEAGNVVKVTTAIKIDKTAPTLSITNPSGGKWTNSNIKVTAEHSDAASGLSKLAYGYNNKDWTDWSMDSTSKTEGTWSAERNDTLYVKLTDVAGNVTVKDTKIKIDKTVPTLNIKAYNRKTDESNGSFVAEATANNSNTTVTLAPTKWFNSTVAGVNLTIAASDGASGISSGTMYYDNTGATSFVSSPSLPNGGARNIADGSDTSNFTGNGYRQSTYTVVDAAGNKSVVKMKFKIDKTAPSLTITNPSEGNWTKGPINMVFEYSDAISGMAKLQYGYDNSTWNDLGMDSSTKTEEPWSAERNQTLYVKVTDNAGNTNTKNTAVKIDKTAPSCTLETTGTTGNNGWYRSDVTVKVKPDSDTSGIAKKGVSTSTSASYSSATGTQSSNTSSSGQKWYGYVKDNAGNTGKCEVTVKKDSEKPKCSISTSGTEGKNGWYKGNVTVELSGNDNSKSGVAGKKLTTSTEKSYNGSDFSKKQTDDTTGTTWYGYIKDNAGNTGSCSVTVYKDTVAPYLVKLDDDSYPYSESYDAGDCKSFYGKALTMHHISHRIKVIMQDDTSGITDVFYKYEYNDSTPDAAYITDDSLYLSRSNTIVISRNVNGRFKRIRQDYNLTANADAWFKFKIVDRAGNVKVTGSQKANFDGSASTKYTNKYCRNVFPSPDAYATLRSNYNKAASGCSDTLKTYCYLQPDDSGR